MCHTICRLQEKWMRIDLWLWPALTQLKSTTCIHAKDVSSLELMLTWLSGILMPQGKLSPLFDILGVNVLNPTVHCFHHAGRSLWAPRCRAETSTYTRECAVTACLWSQSAEDVWCVRTACLCAPKDPASSTRSALSLTTSIRRWSREKRFAHFLSPLLFTF